MSLAKGNTAVTGGQKLTGYDALLDIEQSVFDAIPTGLYLCSEAGVIIRFNRTAVELWGRSPEVGETHERFCGRLRLYDLDGRQLAYADTPMAVALRTGEPQKDRELVIERPDGSRITVFMNLEPLRDGNGRTLGAINCLQDITERRSSDEARHRLAAIVESSQDAIVSKNLDGIIMSWNAGAEGVFGYTAEEAIGRPVMMLIPENQHDEELAILARIRRGERVETYETVRRRKDGTLLDIALTVSPVKGSDGRIIGASKIARDITEKRRAEEQRELMLRELTHRSKNLLAMVQGMMQQAARHTRDLESFQEAFAARLQGLARSHNLLVDRNWQGAPLSDLVRTQCGFIDKDGDHAITTEGPEITLTPAAAQTLGLALYELATNAVKYGALSVPEGQIRMSWTLRQEQDEARLDFCWREVEGPPVSPPRSKGFGSVMTEKIAPDALGGTASLDYHVEGLVWRLDVPLARITETPDDIEPF